LAFQNFPVGRALAERSGIEVAAGDVFELSEFPVSIVVEPGAEIGLWLGFDPRHVGRAMAARMLRQYAGLLAAMEAAPERRLGALPLLTAGERWQLVAEWNDPDTCTGTDIAAAWTPVHLAVAARALAAGAAAAVVAGERVVSYRELLARADGVAR